ncbi:MAG: D-alanyl-D-alanine carboxypeptidase [Clostridia bacterium]|nr:D-alanyl-D-alanine carboxypeptidase [Clostridia bacterium]
MYYFNLNKLLTLFILLSVFISFFNLSEEKTFANEELTTEEASENIENDDNLTVMSEQAIIQNIDTGTILYSKNVDNQVFCGFLPRLMTSILIIESEIDLKTEVTIADNVLKLTPQISSANLSPGEKISLGDLLNCILIGNSQEAAVAAALYLSNGDIDSFIVNMNTRASELGATNTYFTNVTGYYSEQSLMTTTTRDTSKIVAHALTLNYLIEKSDITFVNLIVDGEKRPLFTRNAIIDSGSSNYQQKATGLAVYADSRIGSSMASMTIDKNMRFITIAITSFDIGTLYTDIKNMLDFSIKEYSYQTLIKMNTPIKEIKVTLGKDRDHLMLVAEKSIEASMPRSIPIESIEKIINAPEEIEAPIKKGTVLGSLILEYNGTIYGSTNLLAQSSVDLDIVESYTIKISSLFTNKYLWAVIFTVSLFILLYIIIAFIMNRKKIKKQNRNKRDRIKF